MTSISCSYYTTKMVNNQCTNKYQNALKRRLAIITGKETEVINKVMASKNYCTKVEGVQNISQLDSLISMVDKLNPSISDRIKAVCEQVKDNAIAFSEQVKVTLETTAVKVKHTTLNNIYKKIVSCGRTVRSNKKASNFSKSTQGDSGDPDQPEPPSPPGLARLLTPSYLISRTPKKNRYSFSWQSAPNSCSMVGGGQI